MPPPSPSTVLVTGGAGYIGAGVVEHLLRGGSRVVCVDNLSYGAEALLHIWTHPQFEFRFLDITDHSGLTRLVKETRPEAVVHLAAIVGDPACAQDPDLARAVNWDASVALANAAESTGVERFVFASTCSNYGKMADPNALVDEESELRPVSLYAELKVAFENHLLSPERRNQSMAATCMRFSTVYGIAPRMRFDLTVNEFARDVALGRELVVFGEQFWRPYCHVQDFARAIHAVLTAPIGDVASEVFNVGDTAENYSKKMLVDILASLKPDLRVSYVQRDTDPRDYRVNCDKIRHRLGFEISRTVPDGIAEVLDAVSVGVFPDPMDQRYANSLRA